MFLHAWRWWRDAWNDPKRGRLLYILVAVAFAALAIVAVVMSDIAVAALASVAALVTLALALVLPRLLGRASRNEDVR